ERDPDGERVVRGEAGIESPESDEAPREQARAREERQREGNLREDEDAARTSARGSGAVAREASDRRDARGEQRGSDRAEEGAAAGHRGGEGEHPPVDGRLVRPGDARGREREEQRDEGLRRRDAGERSRAGDEQGLGEEGRDEAGPPGPQRLADGDLVPAAEPAHEGQ